MRSFDDAATRTWSSAIGEQEPRGREVEQVDAAPGEHGQEVDDVEVGDEGVGDVDEGPRQEVATCCGMAHLLNSTAVGSHGIVVEAQRRVTTSCASVVDRTL